MTSRAGASSFGTRWRIVTVYEPDKDLWNADSG
jgi:hypothetical protein